MRALLQLTCGVLLMRIVVPVLVALIISMVGGAGCASRASREAPPAVAVSLSAAAPGPAGKQAEEARAGGANDATAGAAKAERKIIRTAEIDVVVQDFERAERDLRGLIGNTRDGYVESANVSGSAGLPRAGQWKVRVPGAQLDLFLDGVARLGIPRRRSQEARDVSEEFYDLEAHVRNKKLEEARLQQHLLKSTGKLDEILAVERELSRVRGEIEQSEGRVRLLGSLTSLATATLSFEESRDYHPAPPPGFFNEAGSVFRTSWDALGRFARGALLVLIGLFPWLVALALVGVPAYLLVRHLRRSKK